MVAGAACGSEEHGVGSGQIRFAGSRVTKYPLCSRTSSISW